MTVKIQACDPVIVTIEDTLDYNLDHSRWQSQKYKYSRENKCSSDLSIKSRIIQETISYLPYIGL